MDCHNPFQVQVEAPHSMLRIERNVLIHQNCCVQEEMILSCAFFPNELRGRCNILGYDK